jgi:hypothetical protein
MSAAHHAYVLHNPSIACRNARNRHGEKVKLSFKSVNTAFVGYRASLLYNRFVSPRDVPESVRGGESRQTTNLEP